MVAGPLPSLFPPAEFIGGTFVRVKDRSQALQITSDLPSRLLAGVSDRVGVSVDNAADPGQGLAH